MIRTSNEEIGHEAAMLSAETSYKIKSVNEMNSTDCAKRKTPLWVELGRSLKSEGMLTGILENACTAPILSW